MKAAMFGLSISVVLLAGCGDQVARPKLTSISGPDYGTRSLGYNGDKMTSYRSVDSDGDVGFESTLEYEDDLVSRVRVTSPTFEAVTEIEFSYRDRRLTSYSGTYKSGENSETFSGTLSYDDSQRLIRFVETDSDYNGTLEYFYDDDRLSRMSSTDRFGDATYSSTAELEYDSDNLLTGVVTSSDGDTERYTFSYDDESRLERIDYEDVSRAFAYSDEGTISGMTVRWDGGVETLRYSYSDGTAIGPVPTPEVGAWSDLFDLEGRLIPAGREVLTTSFLF